MEKYAYLEYSNDYPRLFEIERDTCNAPETTGEPSYLLDAATIEKERPSISRDTQVARWERCKIPCFLQLHCRSLVAGFLGRSPSSIRRAIRRHAARNRLGRRPYADSFIRITASRLNPAMISHPPMTISWMASGM